VTKHSQSLQESNPLIMSSAGGQAAAVNTGTAAPFNVTGVNPAANLGGAGAIGNSNFAVSNVKRVWGAESEEQKAPESTQSMNMMSSGQPNSAMPSSKPVAAAKKVPEPTKAERKKSKATAALFGGISGKKSDSSDDD